MIQTDANIIEKCSSRVPLLSFLLVSFAVEWFCVHLLHVDLASVSLSPWKEFCTSVL